MTEKYQPIPHRLKNMAVGGHVAGAEDIDAGNGKTQQDINADTYRKNETYSKEQLNNMITTPDQEYLSVTATDETTSVDDIATLIATKYPDGKENADTVYRVGCWDGEQYNTNTYTEYVWDGEQYIPASVKNPGIDEEAKIKSNKLLESNGAFSPLKDFLAAGRSGIDEFYQYSINMETKTIDDVTEPIDDYPTNWITNTKRLTTVTPFSYPSDKIIRCDDGYLLKLIEVNSETGIVVEWPENWSRTATIEANKLYIVTLTHTPVDSDFELEECVHIYIDTLKQDVDNSVDSIANNESYLSKPLSKGRYTFNFIEQFYSSFKNKLIADTSTSVYSDSFYGNKTTIRLSLYKTLIEFPRDMVVKSNPDVVMKVVPCDSNGFVIGEWPSSWGSKFFVNTNTKYYIVAKKADDSSISIGELWKIYTEELDYELVQRFAYDDYDDKIASLVPKFQAATLTYDENITNYRFTASLIRRSSLLSNSANYELSMRNPNYVFRFYWIEEETEEGEETVINRRSTDWGSIWKVPIAQKVGLTIKRRDNGNFSEGEQPEVYFEVYDTDNKPKEYYLQEIEDTIQKVNEAFTEPGLCFLLTTDQHTMSVQSPLKYDTISDMVINMKAVAKRIKVDALLALGDIADFKVGTASSFEKLGIYIDDENTDYPYLDAVFYKWMKDAMEKLLSVTPNMYVIAGNHDDNRYINFDNLKESPSQYDYTKGEMFSYYIAKGVHSPVVYNKTNNGLDYYVDYSEFKIRMFFIDSNFYNLIEKETYPIYANQWAYGYSNETLAWLREQLGLVPNDYSVILVSHMSPVRENNAVGATSETPYTNYQNMGNVKAAIQDFINGGGNYIATLYGHSHIDFSNTDPWLEINFAAQKCQNGSGKIIDSEGNETIITRPQRTVGTYTEDCWNVVLVLPQSRKIKVIRFGAGEDREFTY